jgi:hypothetical protein
MKQKQIHLNEAITMNRDAQVSAEQSRAVMVFTGEFAPPLTKLGWDAELIPNLRACSVHGDFR